MPSNHEPVRFYQWVLLISSLVTLGFLIASAVQEVLLNEWGRHQRSYQVLLQQKASDEAQRRAAADFPVELRQITVPALGVVDRCISCHVATDDPRMMDIPEPLRTHPTKILQDHSMDKFGCTICHNGQGAAVTFRDAHKADIDWGYPMLPLEYTQASCASCHDPRQLPQNDVRLLVRGMELFRQQSCGSCHKVGGRGGSLSLPLDNMGMRTIHELPLQFLKGSRTPWTWLEQHFRNPQEIVPASLMKKMELNDTEVQALTVYMLSLRQRVFPQEYIAKDKVEQTYEQWRPAPPDGAGLYRQFCFACHGSGEESVLDDQFNHFIPAVKGPSLLRTATREFFIANISRGRPGTLMPSWEGKSGGLRPAEIEAIVDYLRKDAPQALPSLTRTPAPAVPGDPRKGEALFAAHCTECHSADGGGVAPDLSNPTFQQTASDGFILTTIKDGREDTAMQAFQEPGGKGLKDEELADLLAYIRQLGKERRR